MPQDPIPVRDPRPEQFLQSRFSPAPVSSGYIATELTPPPPLQAISTEGGEVMVIE